MEIPIGIESILSKDNRWVKLADKFPWAEAEREYNKLFKFALLLINFVDWFLHADMKIK